eukprot:Phypoly_transcript_13403.p1 GENE.Phypoly_transcript_13403~~Phypoly_transcript_13403.p1  ORF type:complete len:332 (+),score=55.22 Phypoly_transcript_13403:59-1054(+)
MASKDSLVDSITSPVDKKQIGKYPWNTDAEFVEPDVKLNGKTVVITGGYNGIGLETARVFAQRGAHVFIVGRDVKRSAEAVSLLKQETKNEKIESLAVDLDSFTSIRSFAEAFNAKKIPLNYLINNAGVMACPQGKTKDGLETQMGVNHFGHFLLTNLLLPRLIEGAPARVISVSSSGHNFSKIRWDDMNWEKAPYNTMQAYGQSKTANVLFAVELTRRYKDKGVISNSLHPGNISTELWRHIEPEVLKGIPQLPGFETAKRYGNNGTRKTPKQGAATTIYAALAPEAGEGGKFYDDIHEAIDPPAAPHALDPEEAKKLWEVSEKIVGLKQ